MSSVSTFSTGCVAPPGAKWVLVKTKPRQERVVVHNLIGRDVEPYCPLYQQPAWHLRAPRGPVPLFPGYVFARWQGEAVPSAVRFCPGVRYAVRFGGFLARVDTQLIEGLRIREGERGFVLPDSDFDKGSAVRIMTGPLKGIEGVFEGYVNGWERARVLVEILRRRSSVEIPVGRLAVVR